MEKNKNINEGELADVAGGVPDKNFSDSCYFEPENPVSLRILRNGNVGALCMGGCLKISTWCSCYNSWECENFCHMLHTVEADGFSYPAPKNGRNHNQPEKRVYVGNQ